MHPLITLRQPTRVSPEDPKGSGQSNNPSHYRLWQRRVRPVVLAMLACGVVGCGSGPQAQRDSVVTDAEVADTTSVPLDQSDETPDSTGSPSAEGGLVVTEIAPMDPSRMGARVVAFGSQFVQLRSIDGTVAASVSDDGVSWRDVESSPQFSGFPQVFSNGERIVAFVYDPDGLALTPWVTDDGGSTWSSHPLPPMNDTSEEFVVSDFSVSSAAISETRTVVVGMENKRVDWEAYAAKVLNEEGHGPVTGEGGFPQEWTVAFADGFEFTLNPSAAGLPTPAPPSSATVLVHDGSGWLEPSEIPLTGPDMSGLAIAAGPAGFVAVAGANILVSPDGVTWKPHPVPSGTADGLDFGLGYGLVGGPHGYVLVDTDSLFHSTDGIAWTLVHEFEDLDGPDISSTPTMNPSAGDAGFVIPVIGGGAVPSAKYFWSSDGLEWSEESLPGEVQYVDSAVADNLLLVVPSSAPDARLSMPTLPENADDLAQAIALAFYSEEITGDGGRVGWRPRVTEPESACIGARLVDSMGVERLRSLGFGAFPFTLLGYGLSLPIDLDDATTVVEVLRACSPNWELLMITSATQGTEWISDESAACVQRALDDTAAAEIFAIELARPYDDEPSPDGPDLSHLEPMIAAFDDCLTPQELNALDWN